MLCGSPDYDELDDSLQVLGIMEKAVQADYSWFAPSRAEIAIYGILSKNRIGFFIYVSTDTTRCKLLTT